MRLHEIYFGNLTKSAHGARARRRARAAHREGLRLARGVGEGLPRDGQPARDRLGGARVGPGAPRLFNIWIDEHDRGALAGCPIVLLMDVFEHAYMTDYGTKRAEYIDAFLAAADWEEAARRFDRAQAPVPEIARA